MSNYLTIENNENTNIKENINNINSYNTNSFKRNILLPNIRKQNIIKTKALKLLKEIDKKKENNNIYLIDDKKSDKDYKIVKVKKRRSSLIKSYRDKDVKPTKNFNVFGNEDNFIKDLMGKFDNKSYPKIKKINKRKGILNKLYGIDPLFKKRMKIAKRNKRLPLEEYQANTFKVLTKNDIGKAELLDLAYDLKSLRSESDSVSPLPPINISIINDHVYRNNSNEDKKINKKTIKQLINDTHEPKDEFEKEQKLIKQMMSYKSIQRGKRNKAFDILPEYLKNALSKRFKKNI